MFAEKIMVTNVITAQEHELVGDVHAKMNREKLRMLPVIDKQGLVKGLLSTFSIMENIIPDYLISGDLNQISYAPDLGILCKRYEEVIRSPISDMVDTSPLLVGKDESLLSVAAAIASHGKHEYALVVDDNKKLLGVISAGDILNRLKYKTSEVNDA
ncbi:CBS domain-containing protein [Ghiorsea bivora]|uniref:CBS domain-containing protein n=1 Tax=Ghiorsea bivora TaxID=1485545 RepID=UPI00057092E7|nr:CBS domain-containing protein [Ghiorsea bivora]